MGACKLLHSTANSEWSSNLSEHNQGKEPSVETRPKQEVKSVTLLLWEPSEDKIMMHIIGDIVNTDFL